MTLIMEIYCVKCKRKTPSLNIGSATTKNNRSVVKGECEIYGTAKNCFTKSKLVENSTFILLSVNYQNQKLVGHLLIIDTCDRLIH